MHALVFVFRFGAFIGGRTWKCMEVLRDQRMVLFAGRGGADFAFAFAGLGLFLNIQITPGYLSVYLS